MAQQPTYQTGYPQGQQDPNQGGYYPPQQQGYQQPSPQSGGYPPPQQGGYQQQQGGYPPQQGGYPPQQGGYVQPQYIQPHQTHISIHVDPGLTTDPNFIKSQNIMNNEYCGCCDDPLYCLAATFFPNCLFGFTYSESQQGSCLVGCCCRCFLCCSSRSYIQRLTNTPESPCLINCLVHMLFPLHICSLTQEARAVKFVGLAKSRARPVMM